MDPKLKQLLDMPDEQMEALSPEDLIAYAEELCQLAINEEDHPGKQVAKVKQQFGVYARSVADKREAERRVEIAKREHAITQAEFDSAADEVLKNMPIPKNV